MGMNVGDLIAILSKYRIPSRTKVTVFNGFLVFDGQVDKVYYSLKHNELVFSRECVECDTYYENSPEWITLYDARLEGAKEANREEEK